jgi:SAM-dependent methyltransferase
LTAVSAYLLDNSQEHAARRMDALPRLFDPTTQRVLLATGVESGWRCLEVGGGGGSIARWLAARVAPRGSVLCTDIDPRHIEAGPANLTFERHDISVDPLEESQFDLIHARLVLIHVPAREAVLERLVAALKPGGWLVIEDFDVLSMVPDANVSPAEVQLVTAEAMRRFMNRGGVNGRFGRTLYGRFRSLGLERISAEARVVMFDEQNGGAELMRINFEQVKERLIGEGFVSAEQWRADRARLDEPDFCVPSPVMWSVIGRKPPRAADPG